VPADTGCLGKPGAGVPFDFTCELAKAT